MIDSEQGLTSVPMITEEHESEDSDEEDEHEVEVPKDEKEQ
jgi:hypothetical protein